MNGNCNETSCAGEAPYCPAGTTCGCHAKPRGNVVTDIKRCLQELIKNESVQPDTTVKDRVCWVTAVLVRTVLQGHPFGKFVLRVVIAMMMVPLSRSVPRGKCIAIGELCELTLEKNKQAH